MGTLLLTLNKWEIVSGDLGGHYMCFFGMMLREMIEGRAALVGVETRRSPRGPSARMGELKIR